MGFRAGDVSSSEGDDGIGLVWLWFGCARIILRSVRKNDTIIGFWLWSQQWRGSSDWV
jgi:hypothetical protein